jgi:hypothetical protein
VNDQLSDVVEEGNTLSERAAILYRLTILQLDAQDILDNEYIISCRLPLEKLVSDIIEIRRLIWPNLQGEENE